MTVSSGISTVREADLILVLQNGEIVEQGSHWDLVSQGGIYQDIYELQLRPQEEITSPLLAARCCGTWTASSAWRRP